MGNPVKLTLRELWRQRVFRVQVYLAVEIFAVVTPLAYYAAEKYNRPSDETTITIAHPVKSNLLREAKQ